MFKIINTEPMNITNLCHEIDKRIIPETLQEQQIIKNLDWREGVLWGKPRYGHPEGIVLYHIEEVIKNVEIIGQNLH